MGDSAIDPQRLAVFRLSMMDGLGPVRTGRLIERFGSAQAVFRASRPQLLEIDGIGAKLADTILEGGDEARAREEYERALRLGIQLVFDSDPDYPPGLLEIHDRPRILSVRGQIVPSDRLAVALVGSRHCSAYGLRMADRLARELAQRGVTVVSGLARGIDAAAHRGALAVGGRTIAVLASGLANIYPPEHVELAEKIADQGALVSEAPPDGPPLGELFPQRNRLISGMSLAVVVVEAAARSGALSTARHALEQNREVLAVPGRIGDRASEGANHLIQQGAVLVMNAGDILKQLGPVELRPAAPSEPAPPPPNLGETDQRLWNALSGDPVELERLLEATRLSASTASSALLLLEMRQLVRRLPGNRYVRA